nr:transcription factor BHLH021 [Ipomoea batatas]
MEKRRVEEGDLSTKYIQKGEMGHGKAILVILDVKAKMGDVGMVTFSNRTPIIIADAMHAFGYENVNLMSHDSPGLKEVMVCQAASQTRFRALKHETGIAGQATIIVRVIACFQPLQNCQAEYFRQLLKPVT